MEWKKIKNIYILLELTEWLLFIFFLYIFSLATAGKIIFFFFLDLSINFCILWEEGFKKCKVDSEQTVKSFIFSPNYSKNAVKSLRGKSQLHTAFIRIFHSGEPAWSLEPNGKASFLRGVCCSEDVNRTKQ